MAIDLGLTFEFLNLLTSQQDSSWGDTLAPFSVSAPPSLDNVASLQDSGWRRHIELVSGGRRGATEAFQRKLWLEGSPDR